MRSYIGFPDFMLNNTQLDKDYETVIVNFSDYFTVSPNFAVEKIANT